MSLKTVKEDTYTSSDIGTDPNWKMEFVWHYVITFFILNVSALYGLYLAIFWANAKTFLWFLIYGYMTYMGVTVGVHRFFTHKSFETAFYVKAILMLLQTATGQYSLFTWVRDHRQHHKFTDTDADPYNSKRGFFFAHVGWFLTKKHPKVISVGKTLDTSDLLADPLFRFQRKYYIPLYILVSVVLPVTVPMYYWNESFWNSFFISYTLRKIFVLHITFLINSYAHMYGMQPYNKKIMAVEVSNWIGFVIGGEQYHNYHHTFPYDYRASELGMKLNLSTLVIDMLAFLGLAWNLRTAPDETVRKQILKSGDGSYNHNSHVLKKLAQM